MRILNSFLDGWNKRLGRLKVQQCFRTTPTTPIQQPLKRKKRTQCTNWCCQKKFDKGYMLYVWALARDLAKASKRVAKKTFFGKFYLMWSKECVKTTTMLWSQNHQPSLIFFWLEPRVGKKTTFFGKFYLMWSKECVKTTTMLWSQNHQPSLIFFWLEPCLPIYFCSIMVFLLLFLTDCYISKLVIYIMYKKK